jgi:dihydroorotase
MRLEEQAQKPGSIVVKAGRIIDPSQGIDCIGDLVITDGKVVGIDLPAPKDAEILDASDKIVSPGLIDMNVQLREPGFEEDETIATGTAAAVAGGITTVACMPSTDPPVDTQASVEFIQLQAARSGNCNVLVIACVSKDRAGEQLAEMGSLTDSGAVAFSDGNRPIYNTGLMRRALQYATMFDCPILSHPEVRELTMDGIMHEGLTSAVLGLGGFPSEAEDVMVSRDIRLAEATNGRVHIMNVSTAGSVSLVRKAKEKDTPVTCEITATHFSATDEMMRSFNTNCKLNPPLRSQDHVDACIEGLKDGTIDVIVSGHAPRAAEKKMTEIDTAPFGMVAMETLIGLVYTKLIEPGHIDWSSAIQRMSCNPARILKQTSKGSLAPGFDADVTVIDPSYEWIVEPDRFQSKSANTPLRSWTLRGAAAHTIVGGALKWSAPWLPATS